jgi:hypothetical protein
MEKLDRLHQLALLTAALGFMDAFGMGLRDVVMLIGAGLGAMLLHRYFKRR